jgi:hypothetical protein
MRAFSLTHSSVVRFLGEFYGELESDHQRLRGHLIHQEGKIGSIRRELDAWIETLPQPRKIAMEATIFTGWVYDHLLPHAEKVKVAHPLMLRGFRS